MEGLERIVLGHPFFAGLDPKLGEVIERPFARCRAFATSTYHFLWP